MTRKSRSIGHYPKKPLQRNEFLFKWLRREARRLRLSQPYRSAYLAELKKYPLKKRRQFGIRSKAAVRAAASLNLPRLDPQRALDAWDRYRKQRERIVYRRKQDKLKAKIPKLSRIDWLNAIAKNQTEKEVERAREQAVRRAEHATQLAHRRAARELAKYIRVKQEAAYAAENRHSQYARYYEDRRNAMVDKQETARLIAEGKTTSVSVEINEEADLVQDIKWLYARLGSLIVCPDPEKPQARFLNEDIMKDAPSSGCVALAELYRDSPSDFIKLFVTKLLPRDLAAGLDSDKNEAEKEDGDPDLGELSEWLS